MIRPEVLAELRRTLDMLDTADMIKYALLAEIDRLTRELAECQVGFESGTRAVAENVRLRAALAWIAEHPATNAFDLSVRARLALDEEAR